MNKFIGINIVYIVVLFVVISCKTQLVTQNSLELTELQKNDSLRLWFDLSDPISYFLTYDGGLNLTVYTYNKRRNLLVREDIQLADSVNIYYFEKLGVFDLKECETYNDYVCLGLDGSSTRLDLKLESEVISYEYWSPEDQMNTELGKKLIEIQKEIESDFNINKIKDKFYRNLKKGRYWNFGEGILIK